MRDKKKLTKTLVAQLDAELGIDFEWAYKHWWYNLRNNGGMRLTSIGFESFVNSLKIEHYTFDLKLGDLDSRLIVQLDRRLQTPYYIKAKKMIPVQLIFFGSKEAVLANLYGNLKKFLDNY